MKGRKLLIPFAFCLLIFFGWVSFYRAESPSQVESEVVAASQSPTLRSLAEKRKLWIGAAVESAPLLTDAQYREVLAREFNLLVPENDFKFALLEPKRNVPNYRRLDTLIDFARTHNMKVRGSPLVWHYSQPRWLEEGNFSREELLQIMKNRIQTLIRRYSDIVVAWDVVNEAINTDGSFRDTMWLQKIGPEYIDLAFQWAREANPNVKLFYSDYAGEEIGEKSDGIYTLVSGLLQRGVPIDGVALQTHKGLSYPPDPVSIAKNMQRLEDLGLEVQFTEFDLRLEDGKGSREKRLNDQAQVYREMMRLCLSFKNCTAFITWGFTDRYTWLGDLTGKIESPLLFDSAYRPKPSYRAIAEELQQFSPP